MYLSPWTNCLLYLLVAACQKTKPNYMPEMNCKLSLPYLMVLFFVLCFYLCCCMSTKKGSRWETMFTHSTWNFAYSSVTPVVCSYNRGWFYHREHRLWFTRVPNMEPLVKTNTYERGSYYCFDPNTFDTIRKVCCVVSVLLILSCIHK